MEENEKQERYKQAAERVKEIKSFYYSLVAYVLVNILLIIINVVTSRHGYWFYWITLIWGIVLAIQAIKIFIFKGSLLGKEWEERKIKEILDKEEEKKRH